MKASRENQTTVFSVVNNELHKSVTVLPNIIKSNKDMAHCFNNVFCQKIINIYDDTLSQGLSLVGSPACP